MSLKDSDVEYYMINRENKPENKAGVRLTDMPGEVQARLLLQIGQPFRGGGDK